MLWTSSGVARNFSLRYSPQRYALVEEPDAADWGSLRRNGLVRGRMDTRVRIISFRLAKGWTPDPGSQLWLDPE
jgi:hypothetical protein